MYTLNHDNIVKIFNHFEEETHIYLVIEFAEGVIIFINIYFKRDNYIKIYSKPQTRNFQKKKLHK